MKILASFSVVPKNRTITSCRTHTYLLPNGAHALLSYSAGIKATDYAKYIDLLTDTQLAIRWVSTGTLAPKLGKYRYVNDLSEAKDYILNQYKKTGKPVRVAIDTETLGLDPYALTGYIVSFQITYRKGATDVIRFNDYTHSKQFGMAPDLREQIKWLLTSPEVITQGANLKYDLNWMAVFWGIEGCTNFKLDTTLVGSLLDENRSNSLNVHAKLASDIGGYDDSFNRKHDKSRMDLVLATDPEGFLTYSGGDTDACYQVANVFRSNLLEDKKLTNFYLTILHPASRAYEQVERVGWNVDVPYYEYLKDELEFEIASIETQAKEILGGRIIAKHMDKKTGELNLLKASLLKDFMFSPMGLHLRPKMKTEKTGEPSSAMEHLLMFMDNPKAAPFVKLLKGYASAVKTYNTYVVGFMKHLRRDGRFHPSYFLFSGFDEWADSEGGTVTGRLSVKDPAIQTIPKHTAWAKRLRKAFIAPPGFLILGNDYEQGELKIAACLAGETTMIETYLNGIDLHAVTASALAGYTLETFLKLKETDPELYAAIRQLGKAGNFGLIYGMGDEGFQIYAKSNYGVDLTLDEASEKRDGFFAKYPLLIDWHKTYKQWAWKHGYIRSPLGRVRHLPMIYSPDRKISNKAGRQAINSPVQSTLSDMSLWTAAILFTMGSFKKAPVFGMIHDQNLRLVPEDNWEFYVKQSVEVMENLPFEKLGWNPQLKFTVDSEVGPNLGSLTKLPRMV